jgi:hypothetical protein
MLGEICNEEDEAGRGLLTAIVVYKSGDMQPGPGWYAVVRHRGYDVTTEDAKMQLWVDQIRFIHDYWSSQNRM